MATHPNSIDLPDDFALDWTVDGPETAGTIPDLLRWDENRVEYTARDGTARVCRDYEGSAMAGPKRVVLFNISDCMDGRWYVSSRYIPTRVAGTYYDSPSAAVAAASRALSAYAVWLTGLIRKN